MPAAADDQMVEEPDIDQGQCLGDPLSDIAVGLARLAVAGWVVVAQNHGSRVESQGLLHDLARIDGCAVDSAAEQGFVPDHAMPRVEVQAREYLVRQVGEPGTEAARSIDRLVERAAAIDRALETAAPELDGCCDPSDSSLADPRLTQSIGVVEQSAQAAAATEHAASEVKSFPAPDVLAEQERQHLDIRQLAGAVLPQAPSCRFDRAGCRSLHPNPSLVPSQAWPTRVGQARAISGRVGEKSRHGRWKSGSEPE
jgi:hypothetical protein